MIRSEGSESKRLSRRDFLKVTGAGLTGAMFLGAAGCGETVGGGGNNGGEQPSAAYLVPKKDGPYVVGLSNFFVGNTWISQMLVEIQYGAEQRKDQVRDLFIENANSDITRQNSQIGDLVARGVDILIVDAGSPDALNGALKRAHDQGVLIVTFDNVATSPHAIVVNYSQEKFGRANAEWLVEQMGGEGKVFALNGQAGSPVNAARWGAAKKVLDEAGIELVGQVNADWNQAQGRAAAANLLSANPDITGIFSQGAEMTLGALQALEAAGHDLVPIPGEGYNGFLKKWKELYESDGWTSIAPGNSPGLVVAALDVGLRAIQGEDVGKEVGPELKIIGQDGLDDFVRPDLPDALWLPTKLPDKVLKEYFE